MALGRLFCSLVAMELGTRPMQNIVSSLNGVTEVSNLLHWPSCPRKPCYVYTLPDLPHHRLHLHTLTTYKFSYCNILCHISCSLPSFILTYTDIAVCLLEYLYNVWYISHELQFYVHDSLFPFDVQLIPSGNISETRHLYFLLALI